MATQTPQQFAQAYGLLPASTPATSSASPAAQFIPHMTTAGERWDLLAWQYYGDPTLFGPIIMANQNVPIEAVFEAGWQLQIPILQQTTTLEQDLPPWETL